MNFKKTVSLVLAILMLMSVLSVAAVNAAETDKSQSGVSGSWYLWGSTVRSETDYTNFGDGDEEWDKPTPYGFTNGKLTTTFEADTYVGVKNLSNNSWYMTDGWQGKVNSATLYNADTYEFSGTDPKTAKDKLYIPGGVEVTISMTYNSAEDSVALSYTTNGGSSTPTVTSAKTSDWYLWGSYVVSEEESTDFGTGDDEWDKPTPYGFKNGTLTATFETDTYVGVKNLKTNSWYMTDGWVGKVQSATLYNADTYKFTGPEDDPDTKNKLFIPAGVQVTITMAYNSAEDSVTLSYTTDGSIEPTEAGADGTWYLWGSYVVSEDDTTDFGNGEAEWDKPTPYGFNKKGTLTTTFDVSTYVGVKNLKTNSWYMTDGWVGEVQSATLYNADTYKFTGTDPKTAKDKLYIPAGVEVTIKMVYNPADDTVNLSYEAKEQPTEEPTTKAPETEPETEPETTTEAPTTEAPTTEPATETAEPTTEAPTTEPATTAPATTEPVTETAEPTTEAPATEPATETPTTEPTTEAPTTEPATTAPATTEPVTEKQKVDITNWDVVGIKNATYNGKKITQKVVVTNGSTVATVSTIYTNNKDAGTATVVIQGTGDYTGTIVKTFKIAKATQKMAVKAKTKTVKVSKLKKAKVTVKKVFTVKNAKGTVTYKKASKSKLFKVSSKGIITLKKGSYKKKTYKIKVKVTAKGNNNYKSKSRTITVKIKVK